MTDQTTRIAALEHDLLVTSEALATVEDRLNRLANVVGQLLFQCAARQLVPWTINQELVDELNEIMPFEWKVTES